MAGKIDKLIEFASEIKDSIDHEANNIEKERQNLEENSGILEKGIEVLKYWNPNDDSARQAVRDRTAEIEKEIYSTVKKHIFLWCIMIITTVIICIKFI